MSLNSLGTMLSSLSAPEAHPSPYPPCYCSSRTPSLWASQVIRGHSLLSLDACNTENGLHPSYYLSYRSLGTQACWESPKRVFSLSPEALLGPFGKVKKQHVLQIPMGIRGGSLMPHFSSCVFVFPFCRSLHLMRKCCQQKREEASPRPPAGPTSLSAGRQNHSSIPFLEGQLQTLTPTQVGKAKSVSSHCVSPTGNVLEKSLERENRNFMAHN